MNRHAFSLAGAALVSFALCLPRAASAQTAVVLGRCDKPIADAETMAKTVSECYDLVIATRAALAALSSGLPPAPVETKPSLESPCLPMPEAVESPEEGRVLEMVTRSSSPVPQAVLDIVNVEPGQHFLLDYFAYNAYASGDTSLCDGLIVIKKEIHCRERQLDLAFTKALTGTGAEMTRACRGAAEYAAVRIHDVEGQREAATCCAKVTQNRDNPNCASLMPDCFPEQTTCKAFFSTLKGDASLCDQIKMSDKDGCENRDACKHADPSRPCNGGPEAFAAHCQKLHEDDVNNCKANAAYVKASRAHSAAACNGNEVCRVLMGEGRQVADEIAAKSIPEPARSWFTKGQWKKPFVVSKHLVPGAAPKKPAPGAKYCAPNAGKVAPPAVPKPEAALAAALPKRPEDFRGFVCADPLATVDNRKAAASIVSIAHACLNDIEGALSTPSREISAQIDEREEKLARLSLKMDKAFGGSAKPAPAQKPATKAKASR